VQVVATREPAKHSLAAEDEHRKFNIKNAKAKGKVHNNVILLLKGTVTVSHQKMILMIMMFPRTNKQFRYTTCDIHGGKNKQIITTLFFYLV